MRTCKLKTLTTTLMKSSIRLMAPKYPPTVKMLSKLLLA